MDIFKSLSKSEKERLERARVEDLKARWVKNPTWPLEFSTGFNDHLKELKSFREAKEKEWENEKILEKSKELKTDNLTLVSYIIKLGAQLEDQGKELDELKSKVNHLWSL